MKKILQIGNYPPPMCGWAMQTYLVTEELRRRGHACEVLNINENRRLKNQDFIDVQNGLDYLRKVCRYALRGYDLNAHVNGMSRKGYCLALAALLAARITGRSGRLTFHGGLEQMYFPREAGLARWAFRLLFRMASRIACDSLEIKSAIENYGIDPAKIEAISTFSSQYIEFVSCPLSEEVDAFLQVHHPVIFSYMSFRPEYELDIVRQAITSLRGTYPQAGFVWAGFPTKEISQVKAFVDSWSAEERNCLLLLGNLEHDSFLTLLQRCDVNLRTPICDGVAASVLESLALGVPVVASENGRRPQGVVTYARNAASQICGKLVYVIEHAQHVRERLPRAVSEDNISRMADWLLGESRRRVPESGLASLSRTTNK